ncbi:hypothetical protein T01_10310 [Trichinella spiralis]|uniref:Uncharacterized protein n=1 Tax=Trichinella spiralis TaxID=6334 RepID=A0A0V1BKM6_TRISP|nr:hypothetical protein T01_10310 [Trichinella spiralis]
MVKLFAFAHLSNFEGPLLLHSNVACKLRIKGSQDGQVHFLKPAITSTASIPLRGFEEYDVQREKEQRENELAMHNCKNKVKLLCITDNLTLSRNLNAIHGCIDYYGEKWICESDAQTVHQLGSSVIRFLQLVGLNQNEMV